jgi:hypothetical protein
VPIVLDIGAPWVDRTQRYLYYAQADAVHRVDLVTMETSVVATGTEGAVAGTADGSTFAYIVRDTREVHMCAGDGTPLRVLHPPVHTEFLVLSDSGDRIVAVDEHQVAVLASDGKLLYDFGLDGGGDADVALVRGDDVWLSGKNGDLRRFHRDQLVASLPIALTDLSAAVFARDAVAALASDLTLTVVRASATQLRTDAPPCHDPSYFADGIAQVYVCADTEHVYIGRRAVGTVPAGTNTLSIAYEPRSQRVALSTEHAIVINDRDGHAIAHADRAGVPAFEDEDHVLLAEAHGPVSRWTLATGQWSVAQPIRDASAVTVFAPHAYAIGSNGGQVTLFRDDREVHRLELGATIAGIEPSPDGRWLAVQLEPGDTAIVDAASGALVRSLEAVESDAAPVLDSTSDLLLRQTREGLTVWDRTSGEDLVFHLDLLRGAMGGRFLPDGRIETGGQFPGLLDIPLDTRPAADIIDDIACRVPLAVAQNRLEPSAPACKPPAR